MMEYLLMKMTKQKLQTINKCQTSIVTMFHWITLMTLTVTAMKVTVIKHSKINSNEIEKEDLIALEENCKLRDLPHDTCLQSELPEEANQVFSIPPGEYNRQYHYLLTHYLKSWQTQTNFHLGRVVLWIQKEIQNSH